MRAFFVGKPASISSGSLAQEPKEEGNPEITEKALLEFIMIECLDY